MNLNDHPTVEQLRDLLRGCNDAGNHVLWISRSGDVRIARLPRSGYPDGFEEATPDMQMRYEMFEAGNEYIGPEAAEDEGWVSALFNSLTDAWPRVRGMSEVAVEDLEAVCEGFDR